MSHKIEKTAVLGAGVMGAQLAGHLANAGIPSLLFDLTKDLLEQGIQSLSSLKPAPIFHKNTARLVEPVTYEDNLDRLQEADWVIEAVAENLEVKREVLKNITPYLKNDVVISTNTSGLSVAEIGSSLPEQFEKRFILTHFFNPPRYLRLVEVVQAKASEEVVRDMVGFLEEELGKGIVFAKDTPNFIGNRIGIYGLLLTLNMAKEMNMTVEEVDRLTGTIVGRPKSATFRTADLVGLDTLSHVARTSLERCEKDEQRDVFRLPDFLKRLIEEGRLGQKTKAGFYKKTEDGIFSVDLKTLEYKAQKRVRFDGYRLAKQRTSTKEKIKAMAYSDDRAGTFFWEILSGTLIYSANRIPEISDDIVNIDNAMRWGFGWELGPFETWDAIGVQSSLSRMKDEGKKVPVWVEDMLNSGQSRFYEIESGKRTFYHFPERTRREIPSRTRSIQLALRKSGGHLVKQDWSASLVDLGDGILDVEFHSILQPGLNPIDLSVVETINDALDLLESKEYRGLVMGHHGQNFCVGANLALILQFCENGDWEGLERTVTALQKLTQRIRFSRAPVVAAPFNLCLGGGFELIAPAARRVVSAELYVGAVEVGVGLIPGAGGNLRLLLNLIERTKRKRMAPFQVAQKALELIGFAKVSTSAAEAKELGYLKLDDEIVMNLDHLIKRAKEAATELARDYTPPVYRDDIILPGRGGRTAMNVTLKGFRVQGKISAHDELVARKLAYVLTGGDRAKASMPVDEQYLLDIERDAFVSLAGEPKTQERIRHMLKQGKPLRN
ncbi:MAG: 3-hydroxyacyl-CoA dehydrogenase/enoyl-CoA hydratase family protein [Candidatus Neomarinimicrobiota bacterium]